MIYKVDHNQNATVLFEGWQESMVVGTRGKAGLSF